MLHQSEVIMTSVRRSVLFLQRREHQGERRKTKRGRDTSGAQWIVNTDDCAKTARFLLISASGEFLCYNHSAVVLSEHIVVSVVGSKQTQTLKVCYVIFLVSLSFWQHISEGMLHIKAVEEKGGRSASTKVQICVFLSVPGSAGGPASIFILEFYT